jgi:hypothetical protein
MGEELQKIKGASFNLVKIKLEFGFVIGLCVWAREIEDNYNNNNKHIMHCSDQGK